MHRVMWAMRLVAVASAAGGGEAEHAGGAAHVDPFAFILLALAVVIAVGMIGRWIATTYDQPSVLGELVIGVAVGNVGCWVGAPLFLLVMHLGSASPLFAEVWSTGLSVAEAAQRIYSPAELAPGGVGHQVLATLGGPGAPARVLVALSLWLFSNLGVILLLFMVGLESTVTEMLAVGPRALAVAVVGIVAPFALGVVASRLLLTGAPLTVDLFLGATLCATSVGITARVFRDLGRLQSPEARVILGAAVIDDILGLVVLAVVVGIVATGHVQLGDVARIGGLSAIFLGGVVLFGERIVRGLVPLVAALDRAHVKLLFPFGFACAMAWLATTVDLASIVGAFAAGLILADEHFDGHRGGAATIEDAVRPLEAIFAPAFFVLMGMQVNLSTLLEAQTVAIALGLTVAAIAGKLVCGLPSGPGTDRVTVGIGMIPRGEVGLIFASIGKSLGVVTESLFSAVVIMVIVTTLLAPVLLKWSLSRPVAAGGLGSRSPWLR